MGKSAELKYGLLEHEFVLNLHADLEHIISLELLGGKLCLCPKYAGAKSVLDLGTGTGMWACQYGKKSPEQKYGKTL